MSRIVAIGSATQDIYMLDRDDFAGVELSEDVSIFGLMKVGDKIDIDNIIFTVGGSGTNAATTFARSGHETIFMGNIGHDTSGDAVLACLDCENIDSSYVSFVPDHTGCSVILTDVRDGTRTILAHRGASKDFSNLNPDDLETIQPDWIYVSSLRGDMKMLLKLFEKAHAIGAKVMFNPGPQEIAESKKIIGLLSLVDVLMVNKEEAAQIVPGILLTELAERLSRYCPVVLITDGVMGAFGTNKKETYRLGVYEQERVRDRTGAGDAFGSGFLAAYAHGKSFEEALCFAAANASKVTQQYGAKTCIITNEEPLHPMPIQRINQSKSK